MKQLLRFYFKLSTFSIKEEFSSLSTIIAGLILYPCFIWIFSKLWLGLNNNVSTFGTKALFAYIGLTEILFMTSLKESFIDKASSDFSLSFTRPRMWPFYISVSIYSRALFRRLVNLSIYILIIPLFIEEFALSWYAAMRFLILLPFITVLETVYSFLLTCLQIRFHSIRNFRMLFGKLFLIFGGVLAPLSDIPDRWQAIFINNPFSDLIFQPCYFSVKGEFYHLSIELWTLRLIIQFICISGLTFWIYNNSRQHYHNFGG